MKEEKRIKTKEEWMKELCIDDEGNIVGEEDLEVPLDEIFEEKENGSEIIYTKLKDKNIPFNYKDIVKEKVEFKTIELPQDITNFKDLKEYIDKLPKDENFKISFALKRRE